MNRRKKRPIAKVGARLSNNLTVLGVIDGGSIDPVYIVWNHRDWCPMACKVFSSSIRAEQEAKVLTSLSHPNIVRLLDLVPPVHLLMPFLEGPTLANMIRNAPRGRLSVDNSLRIATHIGAALMHVHDRGYLHMDVKPSNVIIARGGTPVLFDFGTARSIGERPDEIVGTDAYLAPEEAQLKDVGPGADVFSLGVTIFDMLTGRLPFVKRSKLNPFPQIDAAPRALRDMRPRLPRGIYDIVAQCLERDPSARPQLSDLLVRLNGLIGSGPRMWPEGFDPERAPRRPARSIATKGAAIQLLF